MLPRPEYCICKQCLLEGKFFIAFVCEHREHHMEKTHDLTEADLKRMILKPRLYFLSVQQAIDILAEAVKKEGFV